MKISNKKGMSTRTMVLGAVLTAIVVVLQFMAPLFRFTAFSLSFVLVPIVLGAALCGVGVSTWLGFVFGVVVLTSGDAASFLAVDIPGTIVTVLVKGAACGLAAGLVYKLLEKKNTYLAVFAAAATCPVVNTGVFLIGCRLFFWETVKAWGAGLGYENAIAYMLLGLAGVSFLVELLINLVLSPVIIRLINIRKKTA